MKWAVVNEPDYTVERATVGGKTYEVRAKEGFGVWRLFVREVDGEPNRTIYVGDSMDECKTYAEAYVELNA